MLSRKVTYAIMVLNELYSTIPNKLGRKMLLKSTLAQSCNMEPKILRVVLQQLYNHKYINFINTSVVLTCNPMEVTIYHLFNIFHGGIPLGEELVFDCEHKNQAAPRYPKVALMEEDTRQVSRKYFDRITVASLKNGRKPAGHK